MKFKPDFLNYDPFKIMEIGKKNQGHENKYVFKHLYEKEYTFYTVVKFCWIKPSTFESKKIKTKLSEKYEKLSLARSNKEKMKNN